MKKLLISILVILLLVLCFFAIYKGIKIGELNIFGISEIKDKSAELDSYLQQATTLASTDYKRALTNIDTDLKQLDEEKSRYENMVLVSTDEQVQTASQFQKYEIEYLWAKIGKHARSEGVVIRMDVVRTAVQDNYNLNFTANGSYICILDFISDIENDTELGFKIENFRMVPNSDTTDLQATFTCKDITIKNITQSGNTSSSSNPEIDRNTGSNTNTTNTNTTNTNTNTTNSNTTNTNTSNTNTTNTTSNSTNTLNANTLMINTTR